jgi:hypothetical protein
MAFAQLSSTLNSFPAALSTSIGFIPAFALVDLIHTYFRYRINSDLTPGTMATETIAALGIGALHTARMLAWNNYQFDDGTGWMSSCQNLKNLPMNLIGSWPFIGGYALLDALYERAKAMALVGRDTDSWTYETIFQLLNASQDLVNAAYWDNYAPPQDVTG